jgi:hypothetical protein
MGIGSGSLTPRLDDETQAPGWMMAKRDGEAIRKAALPWYGKPVVAAYQNAGAGRRYRGDFVSLIAEGYHAYVQGFLRASIIVTGEALLRLLYIRIAQLLERGGPLTVRQGRRVLTISPSSVHELPDHLTFFQAEQALRGHFDSRINEYIDGARFLRNRAAHGDLPLLDEWDPDERDFNSIVDMMALLSGKIPFAEGYRFHKGDLWVTLAIRDHPCNTLRDLSMDEKLTVVQQLLLLATVQSLGWPQQ